MAERGKGQGAPNGPVPLPDHRSDLLTFQRPRRRDSDVLSGLTDWHAGLRPAPSGAGARAGALGSLSSGRGGVNRPGRKATTGPNARQGRPGRLGTRLELLSADATELGVRGGTRRTTAG